MDLHHSVTSRYQVLRNEENDGGPPAVEPPSMATQIDAPTAPPTPSASPPAPGLAFPEWSPSPPPYCPMPAEAETTSEAEGPREALPGPPPYSVATSLPTYDEAERAKAAALALASGEPARGDDDLPPREASTASDPDPLLVGNDGIFLMAFVMAFIFNWLGFCLSFCTTSSIAGRCGALCGFGLSLTKWILIVRFSDYFTGYFNGQYWLWWIFLLLGLLLFFRGFYSYLKVRNMSERLATANRTRYIFRN